MKLSKRQRRLLENMNKKIVLIFKRGTEGLQKELKSCTVEYLQYMRSEGYRVTGRVINE